MMTLNPTQPAAPGTLFYFVAMRPDIMKAVGDRIYLTYAEADYTCGFLSDMLGVPYRVYQAIARDIVLAQPEAEAEAA